MTTTIKQLETAVEKLKEASDLRKHQGVYLVENWTTEAAARAAFAASDTPQAPGYGTIIVPAPIPQTPDAMREWETMARAYYAGLQPNR